jgi:hypothetical protein
MLLTCLFAISILPRSLLYYYYYSTSTFPLCYVDTTIHYDTT